MGSVYRLTRDDGVVLLVNGTVWESALALGYVYGWRPAGTDRPQPGSSDQPRDGAPWDSRDYFSCHSQHVGHADARALAMAVYEALLQIPGADRASGSAPAGPIATAHRRRQAAVIAEGLTLHRKRSMSRLVDFADRGGFTIGAAT